jgi:uridine kinase
MVSGLNRSGFRKTALILQQAMHNKLADSMDDFPFPEYFDYQNAKPGGIKNLCFSASGYLLGLISEKNPEAFNKQLFDASDREEKLKMAIRPKVMQILQQIDLPDQDIMAISIAGESGCGKTTLSQAIKEELELQGKKVLILHQDEYFKLPPHQNHQAREKDFEHIGPQEVRLDLLDEHIHKIKNRMVQTLSVPQMNRVADEEETNYIDVRNLDLIIAEGTYTSLLKKVNIRIFINTQYLHTRKNRLQRKREVITDFIETVLEKESSIISKQSVISDITLDQELNII